MKNTVIALYIVLSTSLLIAGGNIFPETSTEAPVTSSASTASTGSAIEAMTSSPIEGTVSEEKVCKKDLIYLDKRAGLMWQDQAYTEEENAGFKREHSAGKAGDYYHASSYCSSLNYAGYTDWRLPTTDELIYVHEEEGNVFTYSKDNDFWTSTPATEDRYYVVFPADAMRYKRSHRQSNFIRCVRCIAK